MNRLYRLGFAGDLVEASSDITAGARFLLLKPVHKYLAQLAAFFGLLATALVPGYASDILLLPVFLAIIAMTVSSRKASTSRSGKLRVHVDEPRREARDERRILHADRTRRVGRCVQQSSGSANEKQRHFEARHGGGDYIARVPRDDSAQIENVFRGADREFAAEEKRGQRDVRLRVMQSLGEIAGLTAALREFAQGDVRRVDEHHQRTRAAPHLEFEAHQTLKRKRMTSPS